MSPAPREEGTAAWLRRHWWVVLSLIGIVALAIYVRTAFNLPIFLEHGGELAGNDPYYHRRTIHTILETGRHVLQDPMLNYPAGFKNVNPPTFNWFVVLTSALLGPFAGGALNVATTVQAFAPAFFGALTVILVYYVTAEVFDRKSGVIAAFLMAVMASHIERSMFGFGDHDSFVLFFITLGMFFYLRGTKATKRRSWVGSWTDPASIGRGLREFVRGSKLTLVYGALAGVAFANVALAWKGFHYATAIIFAYAVFQLIVDQLRRESGLDVFALTVVTMGVTLALAYPYYEWANMFRWIEPSIWILTGFLFVGAFLVPTRDLPALLVLPAFFGSIAAGLTVVAVAFPGLSQLVFGGFGYFQQTAVYQTIAEAHPADFSLLVFNFGVATFYMALIGLVLLALQIRRDYSQGRLFMLAWAAVAIYMSIAAMRFLFNASPVFAVMAGWMTWWVLDRLDYAGVAKRVRGYGHDVARALRRSMGVGHVAGVLFLALAIVVPNGYFALDAGMPSEYESQLAQDNPELEGLVRDGLGTFGQGYLPSFWRDGLRWLAQEDTELPPAERPGFISWWDYGFWVSGIAGHPTVADNFQNNFFFAGRFLAAQNETHAMQILVAGWMNEGVTSREDMRTYLLDAGVDDRNATAALETLAAYEHTPHLDLEQSVEVYRRVTDESGRIVRYFAVDQRLFPFDDPRTPQIDFNSIFYAPITLARFEPGSFVEVKYTAQVTQATQFGGGGPGQQVQVNDQQLQQLQEDPSLQVQVLGQSYEYKQRFFDTMVYRAYVGTPPRGQPPGDGTLLPGSTQPCFNLKHWRLAYQNSGLRICKFFFGAELSGQVRLANGDPVPRTSVAVLDEFGIPHDTVFTDGQGRFTLTVPFGQNVLVAFQGIGQQQVTLGGSDPFNVTDEEAMTGAVLDPVNVTVEPSTVTGTVFFDRDGDGTQGDGEEGLENATVLVGQRVATTDANGTYRVEDVAPGVTRVSADKEGYFAQPQSVRVEANTTVHQNISMDLQPVLVEGVTFEDENGDGVAQDDELRSDLTVRFTATADDPDNTAEDATGRSNATGVYGADLRPGDYVWSVNGTAADGVRYVAEGTLTVPVGGDPIQLDVAVVRQG